MCFPCIQFALCAGKTFLCTLYYDTRIAPCQNTPAILKHLKAMLFHAGMKCMTF